MKNMRMYRPIYSPERYTQEVENVRNRKENNERKKIMEEREKEMAEFEEMSKYLQKSHDRKFDYNDFLRKYNNQIR